VHVHLHHGLKGPQVDANPDDGSVDRITPNLHVPLCS
jgi:hypothetical protein